MEGHLRWAVPDAFVPGTSSHGQVSHEAACVLNTGAVDASVTLTFYFEDREPWQTPPLTVPAQRTRHLRFDKQEDLGGVIPEVDTPFAYVVVSDHPIVVQHSRLDTSHGAYTLATTMAHPSPGYL